MKSTSKTLADSLCRRAEELTSRHSKEQSTSTPPPTVAAQSPIHELIIEEIAASIPRHVAEKLRTARTVDKAHDWIAAAAMYTWIKPNSLLAQQFLADLGDHPQEASLALARSVARTLEPPPPDPREACLDRWGVVLQLLCAVLVLTARGLFFVGLLAFASAVTFSWDMIYRVVGGVVLPDLVWLDNPNNLLFANIALFFASGWLLLECLYVPGLLNHSREFYSRKLLARAHADWRVDSLQASWCAHAVLLQFLFSARAIQFAIQYRELQAERPVVEVVIWALGVLAAAQVIASVSYLFKRPHQPISVAPSSSTK